MAVDCLIFSKDRPAQLDLLLRSIRRYAPGLYSGIEVLYTYTSRCYGRGYAECFAEHDEASFELEHDFAGQVKAWVDWHGAEEPCSFLVDDDVFYRPPPSIASKPSPRDVQVGGDRKPLSLRGGDYDYPFSVDGNVYSRRQLDEALEVAGGFRDPTSLEANVHARREHLSWQEVRSLASPCLVGVPLNRVARSSGMPHMGIHEFDLNERYLAGDRLYFDLPGNPGAHTDDVTVLWLERVAA